MAGELILIVDDNEKNVKLARDVLRFAGYRTLEARSGEDAIQLAEEHLPDVILMDIRLPGMDGTAAAGLLKSRPKTRLRRPNKCFAPPCRAAMGRGTAAEGSGGGVGADPSTTQSSLHGPPPHELRSQGGAGSCAAPLLS